MRTSVLKKIKLQYITLNLYDLRIKFEAYFKITTVLRIFLELSNQKFRHENVQLLEWGHFCFLALENSR